MKSIGDFAENLILNQTQNIKEGKESSPQMRANGLAPAGKDISNVEVPDTFMQQVLGESFHPQETPAAETIPEIVWNEEEPKQSVQSLTEETAQHLVPLLEEVRDLLKEMCCGTSSGQLGINLAGPQRDMPTDAIEKKYGYISARPVKSKKDILRKSIQGRLKRR
ncbi:hypothetical protein N8467_01345 [bacterium]|jgi:hypothetical protein|nr:hypothetical protein [bacterium]